MPGWDELLQEANLLALGGNRYAEHRITRTPIIFGKYTEGRENAAYLPYVNPQLALLPRLSSMSPRISGETGSGVIQINVDPASVDANPSSVHSKLSHEAMHAITEPYLPRLVRDKVWDGPLLARYGNWLRNTMGYSNNVVADAVVDRWNRSLYGEPLSYMVQTATGHPMWPGNLPMQEDQQGFLSALSRMSPDDQEKVRRLIHPQGADMQGWGVAYQNLVIPQIRKQMADKENKDNALRAERR